MLAASGQSAWEQLRDLRTYVTVASVSLGGLGLGVADSSTAGVLRQTYPASQVFRLLTLPPFLRVEVQFKVDRGVVVSV